MPNNIWTWIMMSNIYVKWSCNYVCSSQLSLILLFHWQKLIFFSKNLKSRYRNQNRWILSDNANQKLNYETTGQAFTHFQKKLLDQLLNAIVNSCKFVKFTNRNLKIQLYIHFKLNLVPDIPSFQIIVI